jgi:monomeric isocitrate dehydrogenase
MRNIHIIHKNSSKTMGGGASHFLVFLYKFPHSIGELSFDGGTYTFRVLRKDFFPDSPQMISDCLGKEIRAVNKDGKEIIFSFHKWVSRLEQINRILTLTNTQGRY